MEHNPDKCCDVVDHNKIPIEAIRPKTQQILNEKLSEIKLLVSPESYQRDYRGLCDLMGIKAPQINNSDNLIKKLFQDWKKNPLGTLADCSVGTFLSYLERIDRYDVYDDSIKSIQEDCCVYFNAPAGYSDTQNDSDMSDVITIEDIKSRDLGQGLAKFDAILLYDDADAAFADQIHEKLMSYNEFSICNRDNSFVANGQFEHDAFIRVIDRCKRVICFMSKDFKQNGLLKSLAQYCQAKNITHRVRSMVIPIYLSNEYFDVGFLQYCVKLRPTSNMDLFYDKLYYSLRGVTASPTIGNMLSSGTSLESALPEYQASMQKLPIECYPKKEDKLVPLSDTSSYRSNSSCSTIEDLNVSVPSHLNLLPESKSEKKSPLMAMVGKAVKKIKPNKKKVQALLA